MTSATSGFGPAAEECRRAAADAAACAAVTTGDCADLCADAEQALGALARVLERPYRPRRAAALRRMIEAGFTAAMECAAECRRVGDDVPECERCAASCACATDALRHLLTEFVDDGIDEKSGAT